MTVAARAIASQLIDGDFYDFFQHGEALLDVVVADVMGKGVPAALLGAATKANLMRAMTLLASACTMASPGDLPDPQTIVGAVHHQMTEELIRLGAFVTLCCARIDASRLQLQLVDAGHAKTIHYHKDSDTCSLIEGRNMPLGFDVGENYRHVGRFLAPGDVLLFYSDGITEARNTDGHPYGEQRLMQYLPAAAHLPPDQLITAVVQDVTDFGGTTIPTDDLTCVAVKIDDQPPAFSPRVITVDGRLEAMPTLRAFIHRFCRDVNAGDEGFAFCLQLAVHELAVNIIRHSRQGPRAAPIQVQAMAYPRRAGVHLFYPGSFYQPRQDVVLPPERFPESGYGLFIVNQCVSGVVYSRRRDGTNCIGLYKNITEGHGKGDPCT
jgi:sigma-B regulation protein RsbU (phosphoserine phosphatase)